MKFRYLFLTLVFAVLAGIWVSRAQLASFTIASLMHGFGLTNVTADIHQLDPDQSHLSHLAFTLVNETDLFQLEAQDINISYKLGQLRNGRVDGITINKLVLHHETTRLKQGDSPATDKKLEPVTIIETLKHALSEYIIFNTLSIQQITLSGESFSAFQGETLQLDIINKDHALYAELSLLHQSTTAQKNNIRQLVITSLSEKSLAAELRFTETPGAIPAKLDLKFNDTNITGNYQVNPSRLQRWLLPAAAKNSFNEIKTINGTFAFNFEPNEKITSTVTANSEHLALKPYSADNVALKLAFSNATTNAFEHILLNKGSYIKFSKVSYDDSSLGETQFNLAGELTNSTDTWHYKGGISSDLLALNHDSQVLRIKEFAARISANPENLDIGGNFSTATVPGKFSFALDHDLKKSTGHLAVNPLKAIELNAENNKLSQLLSPWPYPFDLLTGSIKASLYATWAQPDKFSLTTKVKLDDAGGYYNQLLFSGLALDHELEILPKLHSTRASSINLRHLDSGVTVSNISTNLAIETTTIGTLPQLAIQGLHGEIFGGSFSGDDFVFNLNSKINNFKLKATNIDLAEIVKTQQLEDIKVTGRISGTIPVEINEHGVSIEHGAFINDIHAGTIRYNPAAGTDQLKQNPLTGIALDALKDFRYSQLSADVSFIPEGTLTIDLQLKGTSPELDTNRPVHLNINTEQNVITLLKSLRFAQGISDNIDKRVRHQYEKSNSKN